MKKAFFLFLLLVILGIGGICYIHITINAQKDQVIITETVLAGDPAVIEGITVKARTHYDNHLFWDTIYQAGANAVAETEFTFSAESVYDEEPVFYRGVYLETYMEYGVNLREAKSELSGLALAYRELYDSLEPGEEKSRIVYIKDYYDFYPIGGEIDLPGSREDVVRGSDGKHYRAGFSGNPLDTVSGMELYEVEALQEFFKIPVLEEHTREISIQKGLNNSMGIGSGSTDSDEYYMYTRNVIGNNACYFTFDTHTQEGQVMDMSYIPGGYGIYCLPYVTERDKITGVKVEALSMVYALDPNVWIEDFAINAEKTKLLLTTREEGRLYFTVIGIENMETLQRLEIAQVEDDYIRQSVSYEDFVVWMLSDKRVALASVSEEGTYQLEFVVPTDVAHQKLYFGDLENVMDWNGEQLVIAAFVMDEDNYHDTCGFHITVYDKKGLAYCGKYASSLDTAYTQRYFSRCQPRDSKPISVSWE